MAADNIAVVREYLDCWNDGDLDGLVDVMAADVHAVGLPGGVETGDLLPVVTDGASHGTAPLGWDICWFVPRSA